MSQRIIILAGVELALAAPELDAMEFLSEATPPGEMHCVGTMLPHKVKN